MEDAGLRTWVDNMGNVHGRCDGLNPSEKALLIGSHLDTVIDAGLFDGPLGIISSISAMKLLNRTDRITKLRRPVEIIAFSDEEGVRFQTTFLGSAAIAGVLPVSTLDVHDKKYYVFVKFMFSSKDLTLLTNVETIFSGVSVKGALRQNSLEIDEESLLLLKYDPESVWGYIEVHIEQGPVLEATGLPVGLVEGIAGQARLKVTM
ncbi:hypothetical protein Leryth_020499 [Lithospermum erythrorhizon]|nr:hypothetical protein Leryth_020499 [Lithospermum erythrorhizon]